MADKFDPLIAEVSDLSTVIDSAITAFDNLAQQLIDAKDDPEQIQGIADNLKSKKTQLAEAIAKNTQAGSETPAGGSDNGAGTADTGTVNQ